MNKIIQCPSCNTKFALNANQLAGIESPKFHCSRCNTIFSINVNSDELPQSQNIESKTNVETDFSAKDEYFDNSQEDDEIFSSIESEDQFESSIADESDDEYLETDYAQDTSVDETFDNYLPENEANDVEEEEFITENLCEKDHNQLDLNLPSNIKISRSKTETEPSLPLTYPEPEDAEDIKIDWPTDSGQANYEVDLGNKSTDKEEQFDQTSERNKLLEELAESKSRHNTTQVKAPPPGTPKSLLTNLLGEDEIKEIEKKSPDSKSKEHSLSFLFKDNPPLVKKTKEESPAATSSWELGKDESIVRQAPTQIEKSKVPSETAFETVDKAIENSLLESDYTSAIVSKPMEPAIVTTGSENRSIKETTVLKRNEISFSPISDDSKSGLSTTFVQTSEMLSSSKLKTPQKLPLQRLKSNKDPLVGASVTGYLAAWLVPFVFLLILFSMSPSVGSVENNQKQSSAARILTKIFNLDELPSDLLPPRNLILSELTADVLRIKDGGKVVYARGKIHNLNSKPYSNVKLETRVYDFNQISIAKNISLVPNSLSYDLLKEKTFAELQEIQNTPKDPQNVVAQRTIQSFAVAVDITDFNGDMSPKFYGVRVYSVQRN